MKTNPCPSPLGAHFRSSGTKKDFKSFQRGKKKKKKIRSQAAYQESQWLHTSQLPPWELEDNGARLHFQRKMISNLEFDTQLNCPHSKPLEGIWKFSFSVTDP